MNAKKITLFLFALIVIILVAAFSYYFQNIILDSVENLGGYFEKNKVFGVILFLGISSFSVLLSPLTSVPLVPSAILVWGKFPTFLLLIAGWTVGGILAYFIGSYSREKILKHFTSFRKIEYYKKTMSLHSQFITVLFFRLAIPSEIAGYTLGIIRYNFSKYLLATFLAELPFAFFVIYSSSALIRREIFLFAGLVALGGTIFYFFYRFFQKKIRE